MKPAPFEYRRADTVDQAVTLLGSSEFSKVCGGSQSLGPMLNLRLAQVDHLIDVSRIAAMTQFKADDQALRIGAAVTHARIEDGELPDVTRGLLTRVAAGIAYRAVRNRGTIGGSLAHADPAADWVNTMHLLDATLVTLGAGGERRLRATEFFIGPFTTALAADEVIVAVEIPRFSSQARWAYRKVCRKPGEFAEAIAAVWVDPQRGVARALLGALDGMPHVVSGENALAALRDRDGLARVLDDAGLDQPYEREVHAVMLRRALADLDHFSS